MSAPEPSAAPAADDLGDLTEVATAVFGDRLSLAQRYADLLAGVGIAHGHLGPREIPRLWSRHLLNSAVVAEVVPQDVTVLDIGSGAGLPGIPLAICRPDLTLVLVEPMQKRVGFLQASVDELGLASQVSVVRGRAEEGPVREEVGEALWVTARAVAPLDRLASWALPLLAQGGTLVALKGERAADEAVEHAGAVRKLGGSTPEVTAVGADYEGLATWVVTTRRTRPVPAARGRRTR